MKIKQINESIFLAEFTNQYEMGMTFLRYQEYYESPSSKFRGKEFDIISYMDWYVKEYKTSCFDYPLRWGGYNIPGKSIGDCLDWAMEVYTNDYDYKMLKIYEHCFEKNEDFYLIGCMKGNESTMNHEIAHGLFYSNEEYKKEAMALVKALDEDLKKEMFIKLKNMGYCRKVLIDETQAYLSEGKSKTFGNKACKPFVKLFEKYAK